MSRAPWQSREERPAEAGRRPSDPLATRPRVWVLDDSALQAETAARALLAACDVELFADGAELLERLAAGGDPDVLVLDWHLPGISGLEVLRFVRTARDEATLPVLMLTAMRADTSDLVEALDAGANDFVTKPFRPAELHARVATLVRVRALHERVRRAERARTEALAQRDVAVEAQRRALDERAALLAREEAVRAELEAILEAVQDGVYVATTGGLTRVNTAGASMLGYGSPRELLRDIPTLADEIRTRDPDSGERLPPDDEPIARALRGEALVRDVLVRPLRGERDVVVRCSAAPVRHQGRIVAAVAVNSDVTERRRAEEALRRDAAFRERFIGILGHDLRNPLSAILFATATLARGHYPPGGPPELAWRIDRSARRMDRMIRDLLDFTRSRAGGGMPVVRTDMNLDAICEQLVAEVEVSHPGRALLFEARGDARGAWDPDRVEQVVSNLVTNALDYSPSDAPVRVTVRGEDGTVVLEVNNQGPPIPAEAMASLFEPFRRVDRPAAAQPSRGLGLGLYIVDQIVRAHGGAVHARSSADEGTTFTVRLPRG